jgi:hypothetical protein
MNRQIVRFYILKLKNKLYIIYSLYRRLQFYRTTVILKLPTRQEKADIILLSVII